MQVDPLVASVGATLILGLIGLLGWFARSRVERVEKDLAEEVKARLLEVAELREDYERAIERERQTARQEFLDLRNAINGVGARLGDLREKVLSECINHERLALAMKPVMDRLGEIRADIKEIYGRLDGKQDKARS